MFGTLPYLQLGPWDLGIVTIHAFGVFVATGVLLAEHLATRRAEAIGIDRKVMSSALGHLLLAGFIGGHMLGILFYEPQKIIEDPLSLLRIWESLASYAGLIGALIGLAIFALRNPDQSIARIADAAAFALPVGWMFGRVGCAFAHDHPGHLTTFFLGVDFGVHAPGGIRHDLGLEEALWWVVIVALFFGVNRLWPKLRFRRGFYPALLCVSYAPVRFFLEFLRVGPDQGGDVRYLGLTPAQYASLIAFAFGIYLFTRARQVPAPEKSAPVPSESLTA